MKTKTEQRFVVTILNRLERGNPESKPFCVFYAFKPLILGVFRTKKVKTQRGNFPKKIWHKKTRKGLCRRLVSFDILGFEAILVFEVVEIFCRMSGEILENG